MPVSISKENRKQREQSAKGYGERNILQEDILCKRSERNNIKET
jgi:hypothetical protein